MSDIDELERNEDSHELAHQLRLARAHSEALEKVLSLIGDIAFDRDGHTGDAEALGRLVDEIRGYARNPKQAARIDGLESFRATLCGEEER